MKDELFMKKAYEKLQNKTIAVPAGNPFVIFYLPYDSEVEKKIAQLQYSKMSLYAPMSVTGNIDLDKTVPTEIRIFPKGTEKSAFIMKKKNAVKFALDMRSENGCLRYDHCFGRVLKNLCCDMFQSFCAKMPEEMTKSAVQKAFLKSLDGFDAVEFVRTSSQPLIASNAGGAIERFSKDAHYSNFTAILYSFVKKGDPICKTISESAFSGFTEKQLVENKCEVLKREMAGVSKE